MTDFEAFWRLHSPEAPPFAHILREKLSGRWTRFHALPESKRYAENDKEASVILHRANAVASLVLGDDELCWVVAPRYDDSPTPVLLEMVPQLALDYAFQDIDRDPNVFDETLVTFYAATTSWRAGTFDPLLTAVAEDRECVLWVRSDNATVFAPYDGGFDIISPTCEEALILQRRFKEWGSPQPTRL